MMLFFFFLLLFLVKVTVTRCFWLIFQTQFCQSGKESNKPKQETQIMNFSLLVLQSWCNVLECLWYRSKANKLNIYRCMADVTWTKWRRMSICWTHQFDEVKISTGRYTSGDPVYSAWNNWRELLVQEKTEKLVPDGGKRLLLAHCDIVPKEFRN